MPAPAWQSITSAFASVDAATGTVDKPTSTALDDLLILRVYAEGAANSNVTASGFTRLDPVPNAADHSHAVLWKVAGSSEPADYTAVWPNSDWWQITCERITGADPTNPIEGYVQAVETATTTSTSPALAITTTGPDRLLVWSATNFNNWQETDVWSPPSAGGAWTNSGSIELLGVAYRTQAAAGTTTGITGTCTQTGHMAATGLAIRPIAPAVTAQPGRLLLAY